jgi:GTP-binding protein EngB required for normal cell division
VGKRNLDLICGDRKGINQTPYSINLITSGKEMTMALENELIQKHYYKQFVKEEDTNNAIQVLADAALLELKNELPDLSCIRFSQGELYYHFKDYEAAIYKWENIHSELQPWAKKNMADAYYELGMLAEAEEIYLSIESENLILSTEVSLQLFSLYMEQEQLDKSAEVIKNTVSMNPDYPNVTTIARAFFEEYRDYSSVIELAVNEAIRTESLEWFDTLNGYVKKRLTKTIAPDYFSEVLIKLSAIDQKRFEQLTLSFWNSYQNGPFFFEWITQFNQLFSSIEADRSETWLDLSHKYEETYLSLIDGTYYINEIKEIVPELKTTWLKITHKPLVTSAAILAWEEIFPSSIDSDVLVQVEKIKNDFNYESSHMQQSLELFHSIGKWAEENQVDVGNYLRWSVQQVLDLDVNHLLIAGSTGNGKSSVINSIVGESLLESSHSTVLFKHNEKTQISKINDSSIEEDVSLEDFQTITAIRRQTHVIDFQLPSHFLKENKVAMIHAPHFNGDSEGKDSHMLHLADSLLFVLSANTPFTDEERQELLKIKQHAPNLPIHFIINKMDVLNEQEAKRILDDTSTRVQSYFPNAIVLGYSSLTSKPYLRGLKELIGSIFSEQNKEHTRNEKLLHFVRKTITHLLQKRLDMENELIDSIHWNEEAVTKLNGAIHQLEDVEKEKIEVIKKSYHAIKVDMRNKLKAAIPDLLKECSSLVKESSDFRKLHLELNKEMNNKIRSYIQDSLLPNFTNSIQQWLEVSNVEFIRSQSHLKEMCEGFNAYYREERFKLSCDFRVLDDWHRDIDRMTNGVHLDEVNILLRLTPSQLLLKSSGKLFGVLPTNKTMLLNLYKKFIENENYEQVTVTITNQFMMQFELFEKGLDRDISMCFRSSFATVNEAIKEAELEIEANNEALNKLKANPEIYVDPLTLFKVKLRQYELMEGNTKTPQPIY